MSFLHDYIERFNMRSKEKRKFTKISYSWHKSTKAATRCNRWTTIFQTPCGDVFSFPLDFFTPDCANFLAPLEKAAKIWTSLNWLFIHINYILPPWCHFFLSCSRLRPKCPVFDLCKFIKLNDDDDNSDMKSHILPLRGALLVIVLSRLLFALTFRSDEVKTESNLKLSSFSWVGRDRRVLLTVRWAGVELSSQLGLQIPWNIYFEMI